MRKLIAATISLALAACAAGGAMPIESPADAAGKPTVLHLTSATVTEGQTAQLQLSKAGGNGKPVAVTWSDTAGDSGKLSLQGSTAVTIAIPTVDDHLVNGTRMITVTVKSSTASAIGNVTVLDNDQACSDGSVVTTGQSCPVPPPPPPPATQACPDGSVILATATCPAPPPPVVVPPAPVFVPDSTVAPSLHGFADIASNFDISAALVSAPSPPAQVMGSSTDPQGAFRFLCNAGPILYDDPIVYPGQPGKSHLHQFYGNTGVNAYSTYESLRTTGDSTCFSKLNRSAYWMPAMLDGKGNVVRPDYVAIYYKRFPLKDPRCTDATRLDFFGYCTKLPNGLRFIAGFNMAHPDQPVSSFQWFNCQGPTAVSGNYPDIPTAAAHCPVGNQFGMVIGMPDCWDGKNLDTPDHHAHMVPHGTGIIYHYADGTVSHAWTGAALQTNGVQAYEKCPDDHPYVLPTFTIGAWYTVAPGDDPSQWLLSSDQMFPNLPHGSTLHNDWFGAWDPVAVNAWQDHCVDEYRSCDSGNLGNDQALKETNFTWKADPHLVPVPARP